MTITCHSREEFTAVIAGLVREGLTFRATATSDRSYTIELTGGF
jgi:hypothetical protein